MTEGTKGVNVDEWIKMLDNFVRVNKRLCVSSHVIVTEKLLVLPIGLLCNCTKLVCYSNIFPLYFNNIMYAKYTHYFEKSKIE